MTMRTWVLITLVGLAALSFVAVGSAAPAGASALGAVLVPPPFAVSVSCPAAGEQQEGTVPCS